MVDAGEFRFLVECCRSNFATGGNDSPSEVPPAFDWDRFVRLARFHRVQGPVWKTLGRFGIELPDGPAATLARDAVDIATANLRSAVECQRLQARFEATGVQLLFVKGLTLAALAYGDISTKSGVDIDLLVEPGRVAQAAMLLYEAGYRVLIPHEADAITKWHRLRKESLWHSANGFAVDLHTRLPDNPRLIPGIGLGSRSQAVPISDGIPLPTLATDELFAYLAVHGASSAWFRLKWISDFAALAARAGEVERLYRRSQELGAGRAAGQALLLADELFGTLRGHSRLKRELNRDFGTRWLAGVALRQLAGRDEPVEPTSIRGGTLAIHATQFALLPGPAFKFSELLRQARVALSGRSGPR